jgi:hypothetical protein
MERVEHYTDRKYVEKVEIEVRSDLATRPDWTINEHGLKKSGRKPEPHSEKIGRVRYQNSSESISISRYRLYLKGRMAYNRLKSKITARGVPTTGGSKVRPILTNAQGTVDHD